MIYVFPTSLIHHFPSCPPGTMGNRGLFPSTQILWTICIRIMLNLGFLGTTPDLLS